MIVRKEEWEIIIQNSKYPITRISESPMAAGWEVKKGNTISYNTAQPQRGKHNNAFIIITTKPIAKILNLIETPKHHKEIGYVTKKGEILTMTDIEEIYEEAV